MPDEKRLTKPQLVFGVVVGLGFATGLYQIVDYPWSIDIAAVSFLLTIWLFFGAVHAKGMTERGELGTFLTWVWSPGVVLVYVLDITFNLLWGSVIFREVPQELLFTSRVQRHALDSRPPKAARVWADRLNRIDPGHVRVT